MLKTLSRVVPALRWLPAYRRHDLRGDLVAGLTTAVMLVPQGMAYAMLAGLPPIIGLYASIVPMAVYAFFGSSRELSVGPVAMDSLLVAAGVGALAASGTDAYLALAVMLALSVGAIQLLMGVLRLGFLVNFLSHPVISGFTSAAALIIGFSQLKHLLGLPLENSQNVLVVLGQAAAQLDAVSWATAAIGLGSLALLVWLRRAAPWFPRALAVVVLGTLAVVLFGLAEQGVAIVGDVPAGLPSFAVPALDTGAITALLPTALTIALVAFMEAISVAQALARRKGYTVDANQELIGIGLANLVGSFFSTYPVTGGFSRSAVNSQAGARTPLASLITAAVIATTLLFFTPLFYSLPKAVLASIIMAAVFGLIDWRQVKHLWTVKRSDLGLLALTFAGTLALGITEGLLVGVGASLLWFVVRTTQPHMAVLGRVPGTSVYRNLKHHPDAQTFPGVLIVRIDAQFYFGNVTFLKDTLKRLETEMAEPLRAVVIDASSVNQLDSSADTALHEIAAGYANRGIALVLANVKGPVMAVMQRSRLCDRLGHCGLHLDVHRAALHVCETLGLDEPLAPRTAGERVPAVPSAAWSGRAAESVGSAPTPVPDATLTSNSLEPL